MKRAVIVFAAVFEFPILIAWKPFSETDIFVCAFGIQDSIKKFKLRASIPHHSPSSCPKIKIFLPAVTEIWVRTDTQDQLLRSPLVIGPMGNNEPGFNGSVFCRQFHGVL